MAVTESSQEVTRRSTDGLERSLGRWKHPDAETFLRARYEAYCSTERAQLRDMLPDGGVRSLYRAARQAAEMRGEEVADDVTMLSEYLRTLLPLPPFEVWREDYSRHTVQHLDALPTVAGDDDRPTELSVRGFRFGTDEWFVRVWVRFAERMCRGYLEFTNSNGGERYVTGEVFQERDASHVYDRFESFDQRTLSAFLRSILP